VVRYVEIDVEQEDCPYVNTSDVFREGEILVYRWGIEKDRLKTRGIISSNDSNIGELIERLTKERNNLEFNFVAGGRNYILFNGAIKLTAAMETVSRYGQIVGPFTIRRGSEIWRIEFDNQSVEENALSELDGHNSFKVLCDKKVTSRDVVSSVLLETLVKREGISLTPAERKAMVSAYEMGYFDTPKKRGSEEIAEILGVSKTAFCSNLRRGEKKLIGLFIKDAS
jgi:predicted DNA binding protein